MMKKSASDPGSESEGCICDAGDFEVSVSANNTYHAWLMSTDELDRECIPMEVLGDGFEPVSVTNFSGVTT